MGRSREAAPFAAGVTVGRASKPSTMTLTSAKRSFRGILRTCGDLFVSAANCAAQVEHCRALTAARSMLRPGIEVNHVSD